MISCGSLPTPAYGRKSTFAFTPGTMVKFDCDPEYVLTGERRRWCYDTGDWNWAEKGEALCIRELTYFTDPLTWCRSNGPFTILYLQTYENFF